MEIDAAGSMERCLDGLPQHGLPVGPDKPGPAETAGLQRSQEGSSKTLFLGGPTAAPIAREGGEAVAHWPLAASFIGEPLRLAQIDDDPSLNCAVAPKPEPIVGHRARKFPARR